MTNKLVTRLLLAGMLTLGAVACGDDDDGVRPDAGPPDGGGASGEFTHYVTSDILVSPATEHGLDLDGDDTVDNQVGSVLDTAKTAFGLDVSPIIHDAVVSGATVLLHSVHATSLTTAASATWQVYLGTPFDGDAGMAPDLDGGGTFTISDDSPTDAIVTGSITGGKFTGGPGSVSVQLALVSGAPPLRLNLKGARIEADVTASGCTNGIIGGAILETDLFNEIIPSLVAVLDAAIKANGCETATMCGSDAGASSCSATQCGIAGFLDMNHDGTISQSEGMAILGALLMRDVSVGGQPATSVGIGFTCADANFEAANEE